MKFISLLVASLFLISGVLVAGSVQAAGETITLLCLGDSVTHGYPYVGTNKTYPAKLEPILQATTDYYTYNVSNHGVSGYRADQVLSSLQTEDWIDEDPAYVLLMVGGNDLAQEIDPLDPTTIVPVLDQTVSEVQSIIDLVKAHTNADGTTPQVILSAFIPNNLSGVGGSLVVAAYNNRLRDNITDDDVWFTTNWDDLYDADTGQADTSLMADTSHPNEEGYAIVADNWYEALSSLLPSDPEDPDDPDDPEDPDDGDDDSDSESDGTTSSTVNLDPKILTTSGPGEATRLQAYDRHGEAVGDEITDLFPSSYIGGAGIVPIDQSNNGVKDQFLIFATSNGGPQARVLGLRADGSTVLKGQMFVFDSTIRDGLAMTTGDFDNDGYEDDAAACLTGDRAPTVRVYKDATGIDDWEKTAEFTAPFGNVGCNLGTFQYDGDSEELLITPNHGPAEPKVYIYGSDGNIKNSFSTYESSINQGLTASGVEDRIYTTPNNGSSHVLAFDKHGNQQNFWWVYENHVRGDFKNVPGDIDRDGKDEILISPIGANGPHVLAFEATGQQRVWPNFFAFGDETLRNGVGIAVIENFHGVN
ncbi:MAG: SGNH/GDSL hydrolase family protein [Parcubacteria group bacterium]|nr:SGNH/GDSL hydrolase family protein [Parcubacteria group bacterium]